MDDLLEEFNELDASSDDDHKEKKIKVIKPRTNSEESRGRCKILMIGGTDDPIGRTTSATDKKWEGLFLFSLGQSLQQTSLRVLRL